MEELYFMFHNNIFSLKAFNLHLHVISQQILQVKEGKTHTHTHTCRNKIVSSISRDSEKLWLLSNVELFKTHFWKSLKTQLLHHAHPFSDSIFVQNFPPNLTTSLYQTPKLTQILTYLHTSSQAPNNIDMLLFLL